MIESGSRVDSRRLFVELRSRLLDVVNRLETRGFPEILDQWRRYDTFRGRTMAWARPDGTVIEGENRGPDEDGALVVRDGSGSIHRIFSGEVTSVSRHGR